MWLQQSLTWRMPWSHWIWESPPRPLSRRQTQMRSWSPGWSGSRRRRAVGTRCWGTPNVLMLVTSHQQYVTRGIISNYLLIISTRGVWVENYSLKVSWHRHLTQGCLSQMKTKLSKQMSPPATSGSPWSWQQWGPSAPSAGHGQAGHRSGEHRLASTHL